MSQVNQRSSQPLLGGSQRNIAGAAVGLATLLFCFMACYSSWPLGPDFVEEGGLTKLRLAIAFLGMALAFAVMFAAFFLFDMVARLNRLEERLSQLQSNHETKEPGGERA